MTGHSPLHVKRVFWARTKRLTVWLLGAWLSVNLLLPWFARDLNGFSLWGFPLGFWLVAEGALLFYLALIVIYVVAMNRLEAQYEADHAAASALGDGPDAA